MPPSTSTEVAASSDGPTPTINARLTEVPLSTGEDTEWTAAIPMFSGAARRWKEGGGSAALLTLLKSGSNVTALRVLIRTTMAMVGVPALVMLIAYYIVLDQIFTFGKPAEKMLYAGIAGICSVQFVIVGFLVFAFNEPQDEPVAATKKSE